MRRFLKFRSAIRFFAILTVVFASFSAFAAEPQPSSTPFDFGAEPLRYLENDRVKLGIDLSIGGAIVYLEDFANETGNMINSADWGRQIQLSYYSGPNPYIGPNGEQPNKSWAGLGWNPIQSGDCGGNRSKVVDFRKIDDSTMFVRTIPMQWPHDGVPGECFFECRYELTDNGFILDATIINNRSDKTQYSGRSQETPAVYTNAPWYKLVSYLGDRPFEGEPTTVIVDKNDGKGWPWVNYYTPEHWSALLNENDCGLGVYQPFSSRTTAGFHGGDANKGQPLDAKAGPTGYIAPLETTILDWNIKRTYRAVFVVGSLDEIRSTVYRLAKNDFPSPRLDWNFAADRQNWVYEGATDAGFPIRDGLIVSFNKKRCAAVSPEVFWKAADAPILEIDAEFSPTAAANSTEPANSANSFETAELTLKLVPVSKADFTDYLGWSEGDKDAAKERAEKAKTHPRRDPLTVKVPIQLDGTRRTTRVDLTKVPGYDGAMKRLTVEFPARDGQTRIYRIGFAEK